MSKIISIVSGKGGCGKSLFTAILGRTLAREGQNVLMVDMDIFVRGLTILLKSFKKSSSIEDKLSMTDIMMKISKNDICYENLMIERFYECDILLSVANIGAPFSNKTNKINSGFSSHERIKKLFEVIKDKYDYILIDNRAGVDNLIYESSMNSDIILSIAEDDEISRQTNSNLINFFKFGKYKRENVYTIINKARNVSNFEDVTKKSSEKPEYSYIGVIPFDMEILNRFGSERFWYTVNETLYFRALIECWNNLKSFENIDEISLSKYHFPPQIFMRKSQGRFYMIERMMIVYSIIFIIGGIGIWIYKQYDYGNFSRYDIMSIFLIVLGAFTFILSVSNFFTKIIKRKNE